MLQNRDIFLTFVCLTIHGHGRWPVPRQEQFTRIGRMQQRQVHLDDERSQL